MMDETFGSKASRISRRTALAAALAAATFIGGAAVHAQSAPASDKPADTLKDEFQDPPQSARPRVWWHWMNGNITKDGIAKDLAWMKRVGIGGAQTFDASIATPQIVDKRLIYMSPEWKDAFRFAAEEADRQGLELSIASSPGWSLTGGPWVPPQDAMKKLVWSETAVVGGQQFKGKLPLPPSTPGPYQAIAAHDEVASLLGSEAGNIDLPKYYSDVAVLAVPVASDSTAIAGGTYVDGAGKPVDGVALGDEDMDSSVELTSETGKSPSLTVRFDKSQTIRSARIFLPGAAGSFTDATYLPTLEASDDGIAWREIAKFPLSTVPTTVAFPAQTARQFRVTLNPSGPGAPAAMPYVPISQLDLSSLAGTAAAKLMAPPLPKVGDLQLFSTDRIDRAEAKAGFTLVSDYYALSKGVPEVQAPTSDQILDLTSRMRPDGTLDWNPPQGQWKVLRLGYSLIGATNHPATLEATGLEVDKFDGAAVRRYLEHYLASYKDVSGGLVGPRGVRGLLTDSFEVGSANWTPRLVEQFKVLRGYDPTPWLPALTGIIIGSRSQSDKFLYDFRRTLADLIASEHYETVANVAHENGLKLYGEALEEKRPTLGDDMAMRRWTDVPMAAMWTFRRESGPKLAYIADIKGASSVAHVYGQNIVAAESLTALLSPWAFGPADLKRMIDLEFALGVNLPVIHTSVHQPLDDKAPGLTLSIFGQYFNRHESWAELARPWVDYLARNSLMLQQGRNVADVAYFYGEESPLTGQFSDKPIADAPKANAYDFVNADAVMSALANDGPDLVTPGGARYRALYLGGQSRRMTLTLLRKIADLVAGGATVIGPQPESSPSLADNAYEWKALVAKLWPAGGEARFGKGRVLALNDVSAGLHAIGVAPDFQDTGGRDGSEILFVHRKLADGDSYFLSNRKDRAETIEAHFRVNGKAPELWDATTGRSEPVSFSQENGETIVPLTLAPDDAVHLVFRAPAHAKVETIKGTKLVELGIVAGPWEVAFQPGRGAPERTVLYKLTPLDEHPDQGIKYFSGLATYRNSFVTPVDWRPGQPLWLDLGEAQSIAEVRINGKIAGFAWHAPYRIEIGRVARRGLNRLDVRVANLWVNRLIGDAQSGATKIASFSGPTYNAKAPLRRSGLLGPVRLLGHGHH